MTIYSIPLDPKATARMLGWAAVLVILASVAGQVLVLFVDDPVARKIAGFLYVDEEENVPTGFAVFLLLLASLLLAAIAKLEGQRGGHWTLHWTILACGFGVMAIDEAWSFHEKLIRPGREMLGNADLGIFFYGWVLFGIALVALLVPIFFRFVFGLPAATRNGFLVSAFLFISGAIGAELAAGRFNELHALHEAGDAQGMRQFQYSLISSAEECLEFAGVIVFIRTLLLHMAASYREIAVRLAPDGGI
jgi:hypothetical protein